MSPLSSESRTSGSPAQPGRQLQLPGRRPAGQGQLHRELIGDVPGCPRRPCRPPAGQARDRACQAGLIVGDLPLPPAQQARQLVVGQPAVPVYRRLGQQLAQQPARQHLVTRPALHECRPRLRRAGLPRHARRPRPGLYFRPQIRRQRPQPPLLAVPAVLPRVDMIRRIPARVDLRIPRTVRRGLVLTKETQPAMPVTIELVIH